MHTHVCTGVQAWPRSRVLSSLPPCQAGVAGSWVISGVPVSRAGGGYSPCFLGSHVLVFLAKVLKNEEF